MASIMDIKPTPPKIIIAGTAGVGKTALVGTLGARLQVLDTDRGLITCRTMQDKFTKDRQAIDAVFCHDTDPLNKTEAYRMVKEQMLKIVNEARKGTYPFHALCIDSFTTLSDAALRYVLFNNGGAANLQYSRPGEGVTQPEWGVFIQEIENFLLLVKAMPIPVILICHTVQAEAGKEVELAIPTKKLPPRLPTYFDEIWLMTVKDEGAGKYSRRLQTQKTPLFPARTRGQLKNDMDVTGVSMVDLLKQIGWELPSLTDVSSDQTKGGVVPQK